MAGVVQLRSLLLLTCWADGSTTSLKWPGGWQENCPRRIDPTVEPSEEALYLYHTGNHYKVVTSVSGSNFNVYVYKCPHDIVYVGNVKNMLAHNTS